MDDELKCLKEYRNGLSIEKNDFSSGECDVQAVQAVIRNT